MRRAREDGDGRGYPTSSDELLGENVRVSEREREEKFIREKRENE